LIACAMPQSTTNYLNIMSWRSAGEILVVDCFISYSVDNEAVKDSETI